MPRSIVLPTYPITSSSVQSVLGNGYNNTISISSTLQADKQDLIEYFDCFDKQIFAKNFASEADLNKTLIAQTDSFLSSGSSHFAGVSTGEDLLLRVNNVCGTNHKTMIEMMNTVKSQAKDGETYEGTLTRLLKSKKEDAPCVSNASSACQRIDLESSTRLLNRAVQSGDKTSAATGLNDVSAALNQTRMAVDASAGLSKAEVRIILDDAEKAIDVASTVPLDQDNINAVADVYVQADKLANSLENKANQEDLHLVHSFRQKLATRVVSFFENANNKGLLGYLTQDNKNALRMSLASFDALRKRADDCIKESERRSQYERDRMTFYFATKQNNRDHNSEEAEEKRNDPAVIIQKQLQKLMAKKAENEELDENKEKQAIFLSKLDANRNMIQNGLPTELVPFTAHPSFSFLS